MPGFGWLQSSRQVPVGLRFLIGSGGVGVRVLARLGLASEFSPGSGGVEVLDRIR